VDNRKLPAILSVAGARQKPLGEHYLGVAYGSLAHNTLMSCALTSPLVVFRSYRAFTFSWTYGELPRPPESTR